MPADAGRNAVKLAELSRLTGVHIVAPTGLHHERYYGPSHWSNRARRRTSSPTCSPPTSTDGHRRERLLRPGRPADRRSGPGSSRSPAATTARRRGTPGSSRPRPRRIAGPGVPILTHCEGGTGALEQLRLLADLGVAPGHVDAEPRRQGRRSRLPPRAAGDRRVRRVRPGRSAGATATNGTLDLLEAMIEDGLGGPDRARHGRRAAGLLPRVRWRARAWPGCSTGSVGRWPSAGSTARRRDALFVANPARAFAFADERGPTVRRWRRTDDPADPTGRPTGRSADERRRVACPAVVVRGRPRGRRARASSARSTSPRCSTTRSTSRSATRRRPASTSSRTARCAEPGSSPPSSTAT